MKLGQETASRQINQEGNTRTIYNLVLKCILRNEMKDDCKCKISGHVWTCFKLLVLNKLCSSQNEEVPCFQTEDRLGIVKTKKIFSKGENEIGVCEKNKSC